MPTLVKFTGKWKTHAFPFKAVGMATEVEAQAVGTPPSQPLGPPLSLPAALVKGSYLCPCPLLSCLRAFSSTKSLLGGNLENSRNLMLPG